MNELTAETHHGPHVLASRDSDFRKEAETEDAVGMRVRAWP